jgi:hypothetical protein
MTHRYEQIARVDAVSDPVLFDLANDGDVSADEITYAALDALPDDDDDDDRCLPIVRSSDWVGDDDAYYATIDGDRYALVLHADDTVGIYRRV